MSECIVTLDGLAEWAAALLERNGASAAAAHATAEVLVDADRRGLSSHGVAQLQFYLPSLRAGATSGDTEPTIVVETASMALVDGQLGLGAYVARFAMDLCSKKAKVSGAAVVGVRNSSHFGAASCYAEQAARAGCIGICMSNSDPGLAPLGARGPILGTNPIALAAPRQDLPPISLDVATSVAAQSKVFAAARAGRTIPPDWAIGPDGRPTTDPATALAGAMLPMAGHKGFGLALMIDVICGALTGSALSPDISNDPHAPRPQRTGHFFVALDVAHFGECSSYLASLDRLERTVHNAPRAPDVAAYLLPGEIEASTAKQRESEGVHLDEPAADQLRELGWDYGVPFPH